jgi:hypothetical protein
VSLLKLVHTFYEECKGLNVVYKLFVLKVSVGLVTIEGILQQLLYAHGHIHLSDNGPFRRYDEESDVQRLYCILCLFELALLSIPYFWGFGGIPKPSPLHANFGNNNWKQSDMSPYFLNKGTGSPRTLSFILDIIKIPTSDFVNLRSPSTPRTGFGYLQVDSPDESVSIHGEL